MPFEWFVALRYLREGKMQTALILGAVSIGIAVVVFLSALIGGLQASLISKILGSQAHIIVHLPEQEARLLIAEQEGQIVSTKVEKPTQRLQAISGWQEVVKDVGLRPGVVAISAVVSGSAFVVRGATTKPVALRGIEPEGFSRIIDVYKRQVVSGPFIHSA